MGSAGQLVRNLISVTILYFFLVFFWTKNVRSVHEIFRCDSELLRCQERKNCFSQIHIEPSPDQKSRKTLFQIFISNFWQKSKKSSSVPVSMWSETVFSSSKLLLRRFRTDDLLSLSFYPFLVDFCRWCQLMWPSSFQSNQRRTIWQPKMDQILDRLDIDEKRPKSCWKIKEDGILNKTAIIDWLKCIPNIQITLWFNFNSIF